MVQTDKQTNTNKNITFLAEVIHNVGIVRQCHLILQTQNSFEHTCNN